MSSNTPTKYKCIEEGCEKEYTTNYHLKRHINAVHKKLKPYKCIEIGCDYACGENSHLKRHVRHVKIVHKKLKPCECTECDAKFGTNNSLKTHIDTVHKKLKPYECTECNAKFGTNGELTKHIKAVHKKLKPFNCTEIGCDYACGDNWHLTKHIDAVHEKLKPYECQTCKKEFSTNGKLKIHIDGVHKKLKPFDCSEDGCDAKFGTNAHLKRHEKVHKPDYVRKQKVKEDNLYAKLRENDDKFGVVEREVRIDFKCMNSTWCNLDFVYYFEDRIIIIECDEYQHKEYHNGDITCDISRVFKVLETLAINSDFRPLHLIRFNPDSFKVDGITKRVSMVNRYKTLLEYIAKPITELTISYLFYNTVEGKLELTLSEEYTPELKESYDPLIKNVVIS
jgi:KRAB domain-containing zinc finger protein